MKPTARPVDLNLLRIHLPLSGWVSILHRVSGVLLFLAVPLGTYGLSVSLSDADGFQCMTDLVTHPLSRWALLLLGWAFVHHVFAGLRHLALDAHWGMSLQQARQSGIAVLLASVLVTLLVAWALFA